MTKKPTGNEIRQTFIDFLLYEYGVVEHGHTAVQMEEAIAGERDEYGQRYLVDFSMKRMGREAVI